jgi:hypothetical protein
MKTLKDALRSTINHVAVLQAAPEKTHDSLTQKLLELPGMFALGVVVAITSVIGIFPMVATFCDVVAIFAAWSTNYHWAACLGVSLLCLAAGALACASWAAIVFAALIRVAEGDTGGLIKCATIAITISCILNFAAWGLVRSGEGSGLVFGTLLGAGISCGLGAVVAGRRL